MSDETFESKKVLLCVAVDEICMDLLRSNDIQVDTKLNLCDEKLCDIVKDYHAVIVSSNTKLTEKIFKAGTNEGGKLHAVGRACAGVDNIDVAAAENHGVVVLNPPGRCSISAFGLSRLLIHTLSTLPHAPAAKNLKYACWSQKFSSGIVDLANISQHVTANIKAWALHSIVHDVISAEEVYALGIDAKDLNTLWTKAECIAVHMPFI